MQKILVLLGCTGTGKSAVAVACAQQLAGEIVGADSQQIYAECPIGTAQPSALEQGGVPHHLIGGRSPAEAANVRDYMETAERCIAEVRHRSHLPLVVGGTGLYARALLYGLCAAPPRDTAVRAALEVRWEQEGGAALHAELARHDAALAHSVHPHHRSRIIRALEVAHLTGQSIRTFQQAHGWGAPRYDAMVVGLTAPRVWLRERLQRRITAQLAAGWIDETQHLLRRYGAECAVLRAIGYRQIVQWLQHPTAHESLVQAILQATMQYAKRQMTYLRAFPDITWIDAWAVDDVAALVTTQWTAAAKLATSTS